MVKSYRDSATFKRRHGLPLESDGASEEAPGAGRGAGRRRGRGESPAPAEPASGRPQSRRRAPPDAPAPAAPPARTRGGVDEAGRRKKSGTRPTRAERQAQALAQAQERQEAIAEAIASPHMRAERRHAMHPWGCVARRTALERAPGAGAPAPTGRAQLRAAAAGGRPRRAAPATAAWVAGGGSLLPSAPAAELGAEEPHTLVDVPWRHDTF